MPVETTLAIIGMTVVFGALMLAVGWGVWYTRDVRARFPLDKA